MISYDPDSSTPAYEQIRSQVAGAVLRAELVPGTRLPAVRRLAADLDIAPNTVARAYRELEQAGIVTTLGRGGTVIADPATTAASRVDAFISDMRSLGVPRESILGHVRTALGL